MEAEEIKHLIEAGLDTTWVRVHGDGRHFEATVVSPAFDGKNTLQQHRMVYGTLGDRFDTDVLHALSIKTYTPETWEKRRS